MAFLFNIGRPIGRLLLAKTSAHSRETILQGSDRETNGTSVLTNSRRSNDIRHVEAACWGMLQLELCAQRLQRCTNKNANHVPVQSNACLRATIIETIASTGSDMLTANAHYTCTHTQL